MKRHIIEFTLKIQDLVLEFWKKTNKQVNKSFTKYEREQKRQEHKFINEAMERVNYYR